jgi:hypothetical protein
MQTKLRVYTVHYKDKNGVSQHVQMAALTAESASTRVEGRPDVVHVESVDVGTAADKIRPLETT